MRDIWEGGIQQCPGFIPVLYSGISPDSLQVVLVTVGQLQARQAPDLLC